MLNKTILIVALTLTVTSAAHALTRQDRSTQARSQTFAAQQADDVLFDRAKGGIDY